MSKTVNISDGFQLIDISGSSELLNVAMYKSLAVKLRKEAEYLKIEFGKEYHLPTLERFCFVKKIKMYGQIKILKKDCVFFKYLRIGTYLFEFYYFTGVKYHVKYKLVNSFQTSMFIN